MLLAILTIYEDPHSPDQCVEIIDGGYRNRCVVMEVEAPLEQEEKITLARDGDLVTVINKTEQKIAVKRVGREVRIFKIEAK